MWNKQYFQQKTFSSVVVTGFYVSIETSRWKSVWKKVFAKPFFGFLTEVLRNVFDNFSLQGGCKCSQRVQSIICLKEIFSCKQEEVLRRFPDFEEEIFEPLSKKFQKGCKKIPFMCQEEQCEWIFSPNILFPYFYSDIEQKIFDCPRNFFWEACRNEDRSFQVK